MSREFLVVDAWKCSVMCHVAGWELVVGGSVGFIFDICVYRTLLLDEVSIVSIF